MPGRTLAGQTVYGNALSLAGASSQYAGRSNFSSATTNVSFMCWYKPSSFASQAKLLSNGSNSGQEGYELLVDTSGVFKVNLQFTASGSSGVTLSTGTWYHLACTRAGSGTAWQLYVNGVAQGTPITNNNNSATHWLTIGAWRDDSGTATQFADGLIDDVRLYERQLSAAEILQIYQLATAPNTTSDVSNANLVGWWKMDESSGNPADGSGNSRTLTAVASPTFAQGVVEISNVPARTTAGVRTTAAARTLAS